MKRMKINIAVLLLTVIAAPCLFADGLGIKAGINVSDLTNLENQYIEMGKKSGLAVGLFYRFDLTDSFSLQPEMLYTRKGVGDSGVTQGNEWSLDFNIDYLEFPLLVKYRFTTSGRLEPNLFAGPYMAIKLSAQTKVTLNEESVSEDVEDISSTDFGIIIGAGLDFELWTGHLVLDARYGLGLVDVSSEGMEKRTLHRVFTVMLGYRF